MSADKIATEACPCCGCHLRNEFKCNCGEIHSDVCANCGRFVDLPPTEHIELGPFDTRCDIGAVEHEHNQKKLEVYLASIKNKQKN